MLSAEALVALARRWLACFEHADLDGLLALHADDAVHTSPKIPGRRLEGRAALRAWWSDAFVRLPGLRYQEQRITPAADGRRVVIEYLRRAPGQEDYAVAQILDVNDAGLIVASRVFHG